MEEQIRLAKYFTDCGVLSRRAAEEEIKKGRVKVNGITAIYEEDGSYWAFYENGEYGLTGVDMTDIDPNVAYSFVQTKE